MPLRIPLHDPLHKGTYPYHLLHKRKAPINLNLNLNGSHPLLLNIQTISHQAKVRLNPPRSKLVHHPYTPASL